MEMIYNGKQINIYINWIALTTEQHIFFPLNCTSRPSFREVLKHILGCKHALSAVGILCMPRIMHMLKSFPGGEGFPEAGHCSLPGAAIHQENSKKTSSADVFITETLGWISRSLNHLLPNLNPQVP